MTYRRQHKTPTGRETCISRLPSVDALLCSPRFVRQSPNGKRTHDSCDRQLLVHSFTRCVRSHTCGIRCPVCGVWWLVCGAGHHSVYLADGVIGVLTGCAILGYSCCCLLPLIGYAFGGLFGGVSSLTTASGRRRGGGSGSGSVLVVALVAASLVAAAWSSWHLVPYNRDNPRRITITHLHETGSWVPEVGVSGYGRRLAAGWEYARAGVNNIPRHTITASRTRGCAAGGRSPRAH